MKSSSAKPPVAGLIVPMVTPVLASGKPDLAGVVKLTDWLLEAGAGGLFVAGTTGRFSHFTPEELAEVCRVVVEHCRRRAPVLAGIADSGLHRMQSNAERMTAAGADYLVATAPYYLKYSPAERESLLTRLIETAARPIMLYHIPELVGAELRPEWICEIGKHRNVVGLKDSGNNFEFFDHVLRQRPRPDFVLIQGKEPLLARAMAAGADGVVVSLAHFDPKVYVRLCAAGKAGRAAELEQCQRDVQQHYDRLLLALKTRPYFSSLMLLIEQALATQGLPLRLLADHERV